MAEVAKLDWSQYRARRLYFILAFVSAFVLIAAISSIESIPSFLPPLLWFAWGIGIVAPMAFRFGFCPCPRCGKPIHFKNGFGYPFSPRCLHCGVKIGQADA